MFIKSFILGSMVIGGLMNMLGMVEYEDTIVESKPTVAIEEKVEVEEAPKVPLGHQMALKQAESYVKHSSFSKKGLYNQLTYEGEGYSDEEAQYAVENVEVDWKAEALEQGKSYVKHSSFSKQGLYNQLTYEGEGYTDEEAQYAVDEIFGK